MTRDVILTLSLLLVAGLFARPAGDAAAHPRDRLPAGRSAPLLGPSALDVIDVPLDSLAAQLVFTLGVSTILFYGGLNLSLEILRKVWLSLGLLSVVGVIVTAVITGAAAALVFGLPFEQGLLIGRRALPHRPGHPHPALHRLAAAAEGGADRGRRVGLQRPDRRGAGARHRRRAGLRAELADRAGGRLRRPARPQHRGRRPRRHRAVGRHLEPPHGDLARVVGDRRAGGRRDVLRLARLRRRQRLPRRLPRRADRRQHEDARALDARRAQPRPDRSRRAASRTS